jgi:hypothetical protein
MSGRAHAMPFGAARTACAIPASAAPLAFARERRGAQTPFPSFCVVGSEPGRAASDVRRTELRRFSGGKLDRTGRDSSSRASWLAPSAPGRSQEGADG